MDQVRRVVLQAERLTHSRSIGRHLFCGGFKTLSPVQGAQSSLVELLSRCSTIPRLPGRAVVVEA